jgi:hypothetical protein
MEIAFPLLQQTRNSRVTLSNSIRKMVSAGSQNLWRTPFMPQVIRSLKNSGPGGEGLERLTVGLQIVGGVHQSNPCFRLSGRIRIQQLSQIIRLIGV